eukprot:CAMPEP_0119361192 /NCGR_PEP_ID=MMETSP1334-20130426/8567_1 /TAXON_ID=127549 /ORGANISM="Calcidiscus leptoporus, Strain RCC1130" /LENGTH=115 /DNA_ID=CAMNT_0007376143 /DNA_START=198 /DNA_END=544 /DNA_ORIENTATION=-
MTFAAQAVQSAMLGAQQAAALADQPDLVDRHFEAECSGLALAGNARVRINRAHVSNEENVLLLLDGRSMGMLAGDGFHQLRGAYGEAACAESVRETEKLCTQVSIPPLITTTDRA